MRSVDGSFIPDAIFFVVAIAFVFNAETFDSLSVINRLVFQFDMRFGRTLVLVLWL